MHGMISCVNGVCSRDAPTNTISGSGSWYYDGEKLELSYIGGPGVWFTVVKASPTHIELTDDKGDIIHLLKR